MPLRYAARELPARLRPERAQPPARYYTGPLPSTGELVAEHATTATHHAGPCARCDWAMLAGDRVGRLVSSGQWAHVSCTGQGA